MLPVDAGHYLLLSSSIVLQLLKSMSVLILLIFCSLLVASGFLFAFLWSVKNGQYKDDYTPSVRMLFDDKPANENKNQL
jgi:cbb3-type cytochrome oxidase maturation protein